MPFHRDDAMLERRPLLSSSPASRSMSTVRPEPLDQVVDPGDDIVLSTQKFSPSSNPRLRRDARSMVSKEQWRRFLSSPGITLSFANVSIVHGRCWSPQRDRRLVLQSCIGLFEPAKLHVVVDVDRTMRAGLALLDVLSGSASPAQGTVTGNNVPVSSAKFRRAVGLVATDPETIAFGNLTVGENIAFALEMRCRCPPVPPPTEEEMTLLENERRRFGMENSRCCTSTTCCCSPTCISEILPFLKFGHEAQWSRTLAAASFFDLDTSRRARDLSRLQRLLLVLAMELVLDPPIIFLSIPSTVAELGPHNIAELMFYLKRLCIDLGKTVVCLLSSLPFTVFDNIDTVVLLGVEGQTLYSGDKSEMLTYVSTLGLPADLLASPMYDSFSPGSRATFSLLSSNSVNSSSFASGGGGAGAGAAVAGTPAEGGRGRSASAPAATRDTASNPLMMGADAPPSLRRGTTMITDDEGNLVVNTGQAVVDLAVLWAENSAITAKFAAYFYDSEARRVLASRQSDFAIGTAGSSVLPANNISFLKFQTQSSWRQIISLMHVFFLQSIRASDLYILWATLTIVLGFTSWLVSNQNDDKMGMMNIRGIMFLLLFVTLQVNVGHADMYTAELQLYRYQRDSGFYSMPVYIAVLLIRIIASRVVFLVTIVPFVLYLLESSRGLITMIGLLSVAHATVVYGKAALIGRTRVVQVVSLLYVGYCAILSGFLINLTSLPSVFGDVSLLRLGYAAALSEQLKGKTYTCDGSNSSVLVNRSTSYCYYGDQYLELEGFQFDSIDRSTNAFVGVAIIALMIISIRLVCM